MRSEWPSSSRRRSPSASSRDTVGTKGHPSLWGQASGGPALPCRWYRTSCLPVCSPHSPWADGDFRGHFPRAGTHRDPRRLPEGERPHTRLGPCQTSALTLVQVIMQGASVAGAGGGDLRAGHVAVGREGDVAIPARLQAHLFGKHLHEADGNEQWAQKAAAKRVRGAAGDGSPTLLLSSSSREK